MPVPVNQSYNGYYARRELPGLKDFIRLQQFISLRKICCQPPPEHQADSLCRTTTQLMEQIDAFGPTRANKFYSVLAKQLGTPLAFRVHRASEQRFIDGGNQSV